MENKRYVYSRKLTSVGSFLLLLCLGLFAFGQTWETDLPTAAGGPGYDLTRHTFDGGGVMFSTADGFELSGTIGQPDAGMPMISGEYELTGGFWFALAAGDCNTDGGVNVFDHEGFAECLNGPNGGLLTTACACYDLDQDQDVDMEDAGLFVAAFDGP